MIDPRRIKQILINLLSNAHKFTPERGRIIIETKKTPEGGVTISVADTGVGMSQDDLAVALKPFGQVKADHLRAHEGTGPRPSHRHRARQAARRRASDRERTGRRHHGGADTAAAARRAAAAAQILRRARARAPLPDNPPAERQPMSEPAQKLQPPAQSQSGQFRERRGVPAMPPKRIAHIVSVSGARAVAVLERTAGRVEAAIMPACRSARW